MWVDYGLEYFIVNLSWLCIPLWDKKKTIFPSSVEIFHAPLSKLLASQRLTHVGNEIVHKQRLFLLSTMT
jgi:hypothetical protein